MKILIVHNNYAKYSGEEVVVDKMASMLQDHGHEVCFYRKTTEGERDSLYGKIKVFFGGIYSPSGVKGMKEILKKEKPDLINIHNLYPFISPAALFECKKTSIPVIMTVHNFRLICPTGLFMRKGKPCDLCLKKGSEWDCIKYNCEQSVLKSIGYTLRNTYARRSNAYRNNVDMFVCITEFQKKKLIEARYNANKITVISNFADVIADHKLKSGNYVAFCGRLSQEKGIDMIIEVAKRNPEILFKLAGELHDKELIDNVPCNCELVGYLSDEKLRAFYREASFFVMASKCYEGFPMSILEAAQYKKCVIAPNHGGFVEIIGSDNSAIGKLFTPNNINDFEKQIVSLWHNQTERFDLGMRAFEKLKYEYSSSVIYEKWNSLFKSMINYQ